MTAGAAAPRGSTRSTSAARSARRACARATRCPRTSSPTPDVLDAILDQAEPEPGSARARDRAGARASSPAACSTRARAVTAVELDRGLAAFLRERFAAAIDARAACALIEGDALDQDLARPRRRRRTTSSPTCRTTSRARSCTRSSARRRGRERLVLMVQREVAERIAAPPGRMSYLSVFVQYHAARPRRASASRRRRSSRRPAVDSAVIVVEPYAADDRLAGRGRRTQLWRLVQAGVPRAAQDAPQRARPAAAGRRDARRRGRSRPAGIDAATGGRRRSAVGEWLALREALGRSIGCAWREAATARRR